MPNRPGAMRHSPFQKNETSKHTSAAMYVGPIRALHPGMCTSPPPIIKSEKSKSPMPQT